jgi:REP element-mobilizing transposase RayT
MLQTYHPEFLTVTILNWKYLFAGDQTKTIVVDSLQWLVQNKRCAVNAFLIMPNHIHLLWKIADGFERKEGQGAFTHRCWRGRQHQPEYKNAKGVAYIYELQAISRDTLQLTIGRQNEQNI